MAESVLKKLKILVVDDEVLIRETLSYFLQDQGAKVVCAENGSEALKILRTADFDVVISDYKMSFGDGLTLLTVINKEIRPKPKLFMCSGNIEPIFEKAKALGAIEVFEKPFAYSHIIRKIADALKDLPAAA